MKNPQKFYWEILSPKKAVEIYKIGNTELFKLFSDDTEALIESLHDLYDAIDLGIEIGIEKKYTNLHLLTVIVVSLQPETVKL